jgi:predicted DNA-binding WGR domain protein
MKNYLNEWEEIVNAQDIPKALIKHFSYLADTPGYVNLLELVFSKVTSVSMNEQFLQIRFLSKEILTAYAPSDLISYAKYPKSFQECMRRHSRLEFPDNSGIIMWAVDNVKNDPWDENDPWNPIEAALYPLEDYGNYWVYHPKEKNDMGEPAICRIDHGGGTETSDAIQENCGALFLMRLAEDLHSEDPSFNVSDFILKPATVTKTEQDIISVKKYFIKQSSSPTIPARFYKIKLQGLRVFEYFGKLGEVGIEKQTDFKDAIEVKKGVKKLIEQKDVQGYRQFYPNKSDLKSFNITLDLVERSLLND